MANVANDNSATDQITRAHAPLSGADKASQSASSLLGPIDAARVKAQMRRWQDCVLDLTKSNPLIGLNRSRVAKFQVIAPDMNALFSTFVIDEKQLRMPLVRKRNKQSGQILLVPSDDESEFVIEPGDITLEAKPIDLMRRLRRIHNNARTTLEERGVTTLYLTFGALKWKDDLLGESVSPLWMVPCEFESKGPDSPLRLCMADEDAQINPALEYYLRERHKVELPELPDEPEQQSLTKLLKHISGIVREQAWQVTEEVWLSTFSFESLVIYRDLQALIGVAITHPVIGALSRATKSTGKSEALPHDLDTLPTPTTVPIPVLPTDSSQLEALTLSSLGHHVVVHGPPGTGKSQTIANLIANALDRNKKVLFVSAKMAALNVVHDRIKELGLQCFCLEAHSTKAGKQKIVDELRRTLEAETSHDGEALDRELHALLRVRDELNTYARELHATLQPLGLSVYRANAHRAHLEDVPDVRGALPWPNPLDASQNDFEQCIHALEEIAANAEIFDQRTTHPWRGFSPSQFGLVEQESLEASLRAVADLYQKISPLAEQLEGLIFGASSLSISEWILFRQVLTAVAETERLPKDWWRHNEETLANLAKTFAIAAEQKRELDSLLPEIHDAIDRPLKDVVNLLSPIADLYGTWQAFFMPSHWKWRKQVISSLCKGRKFEREWIKSLYEKCCRASEIERWFNEQRTRIDSYLDASVASSPIIFKDLSLSFTVAVLCKQALTAAGKEAVPILSLSAELRSSAEKLLLLIPSSDTSLPASLQRIDNDWPHGFIQDALASKSPQPAVANRAISLLSSMKQVREWVLLDRALKRCAECGLPTFLDSFGTVSASNAHRIFERRFLNLWISGAMYRSQMLAGFTEAKGQDLLNKYRALDESVRRLAIARIRMTASSVSARVRAAEIIPESASEIGILRRELQKRKRIKPLRKLFAEIPHVLQALKPCLLMSPISVSTYLKPDVFHFDLVVFDEASQLPTAEAIPSILRASQVVVAGDPKQLPPTSFFESALIPEEEEDDEDLDGGQAPLESLLDDCIAVVPVFHESYLRWHYRSRDERLIKFSNHFFYDNKLITFPAANTGVAGQGVRFKYVPDGVYDRGRSRMNRIESRIVARLALEHFEHYPERSLGIVALNLSQKEAIEDAIAEALLSRPDLVTFFDKSRHESVFVKSLENVQGDERDTMIISVGYGRDQAGGLSMNFGPINTDGGWRRLNVLITRAKWECILVSSLRAQDLSGVNPNNRGAVSLRSFLEFAERSGDLLPEAAVQTNAETNEFEESVRAAILDRGFKVDMQVGASRYRIDLAVRDHRDERRYLLGIECDGVTYHSSRTARDRDLLRQLVLQRMGWRIHRVWSTEWFHDREQAIVGILRSIEQAQQAPVERPVYAPPPDPIPITMVSPHLSDKAKPEGKDTRLHKPGIPYVLFNPSQTLNRDSLLKESCCNELSNTIIDLVNTEGPIHHDFLVTRLKEIHHVAKAGSNVQSNIKQALRSAENKHSIIHNAKPSFYCSPDGQIKSFRLPTETVRRPIEYIAPSELSLAILYFVEDQFGVTEEYLPTAIARLFGIERLGGESADIIRHVIKELVSEGSLRRNGMQVHLR
jgi:very-short-patch-repair endonuclease